MIEQIKLPYSLDALEPYYSKETLDLHYNILYKNYVQKTNQALVNLDRARTENNFTNIKCLEKELSFQGSGALLHALFFENLKPANEIDDVLDFRLERQIIKDFGSFDKFKNQFVQAAINVEASGWCILVWVREFNKLEILQCEKHQNLTLWGCIPILVIDMWEHSYYLQYKTRRIDYINAFWNIVNWKEANKRLARII